MQFENVTVVRDVSRVHRAGKQIDGKETVRYALALELFSHRLGSGRVGLLLSLEGDVVLL